MMTKKGIILLLLALIDLFTTASVITSIHYNPETTIDFLIVLVIMWIGSILLAISTLSE